MSIVGTAMKSGPHLPQLEKALAHKRRPYTAKNKYIKKKKKNKGEDFPGGTVVKNPPANAGDTSSSPGLRRSHRPCAKTTEPALQSPQATTTEARAPRAHALQQRKSLQ